MWRGVVRTERHGALKLPLCAFETPVVTEGDVGEAGVSLAEQGVQLEGVLGSHTGLRFGLERRHIVVRHLPEQSVGAGETRVGESVLRISLDRLLVGLDAFVNVAAIRPIESATEVSIVCFWVDEAFCDPR